MSKRRIIQFLMLCVLIICIPVKANASFLDVKICRTGKATTLPDPQYKGYTHYEDGYRGYGVLEIKTDVADCNNLQGAIYSFRNQGKNVATLYFEGKTLSIDEHLTNNFKYMLFNVEDLNLHSTKIKCEELKIQAKKINIEEYYSKEERRFDVEEMLIEGDVDSHFFEMVQAGSSKYKNHSIEFYPILKEKKEYYIPAEGETDKYCIGYSIYNNPGYKCETKCRAKDTGKEITKYRDSEDDFYCYYSNIVSSSDKKVAKVVTIMPVLIKSPYRIVTNGGMAADGKTAIPRIIYMTYGSSYNVLPKLVKKGYIHSGWKIKNHYTEKNIKSNEIYVETVPGEITALWTSKKVNITLDYADGKTPKKVITMNYGDECRLPTPERKGYDFIGWLDENKLHCYEDGDILEREDAFTLTAGWLSTTDEEEVKKKDTNSSNSSSTKKSYSATVKVKKAKSAKGYEFQLCTSKKFKEKSGVSLYKKTSKKNKCTFKNITKSGTYYYRYRSYKKKGKKKSYSKWSKAKKITIK